MEIDLNHAPSEAEEENSAAAFISSSKLECDKLGRCNCNNNACLSACNSSSSSSNAISGTTMTSQPKPSKPSSSSIYMELWHACAGPLISLPNKGSIVVYFPQGHLEQAASSSPSPFSRSEIPSFNLPPQIFCRVVDFHLMANKENDEVYTQLTLLPLPELIGLNLEGENAGVDDEEAKGVVVSKKSTTHMFCKTLTASDTSTHGGFSVPRRAAEDCFPPLDYKEQRPSQELVAKDLHGVEWKFRHIYRGQPRRHLLTTGWSLFVGQKKLISGDAVLFLRHESGELRLGIRRAARQRNYLPDSIIKSQNSYTNVLSSVANALSRNTTFSVFHSPRANHADFIVPYKNYAKCLTGQISVGMRFRVRFDLDDSPEKRLSGVVTGVGDVDPYKWPNSKWRCLTVRWDGGVTSNIQERVSPWDIELSGNYASTNTQSSPKMKKLRSSAHPTPHNSGSHAHAQLGQGAAFWDFKETTVKSTSSKVLQGQENLGLASNLLIRNNGMIKNHTYRGGNLEFLVSSCWFPKVLQGQEVCSMKSLAHHRNDMNNLVVSPPSHYPLASEGDRNVSFLHNGVFGLGNSPCSALSSFSNIQTGNRLLTTTPCSIITPNVFIEPPKATEKTTCDARIAEESVRKRKLLGGEDPSTPRNTPQGSTKRSCTKVHKQGSLVGRAVDLSRMHGYEDLITELERLFIMEGLLSDRKNGWRLLYADTADDVMVVGDSPWTEFVDDVTKIYIYTQEEVDKLNAVGINSDDAKSCLEEALNVAADACKSSSVGPPDFSPV